MYFFLLYSTHHTLIHIHWNSTQLTNSSLSLFHLALSVYTHIQFPFCWHQFPQKSTKEWNLIDKSRAAQHFNLFSSPSSLVVVIQTQRAGWEKKKRLDNTTITGSNRKKRNYTYRACTFSSLRIIYEWNELVSWLSINVAVQLLSFRLICHFAVAIHFHFWFVFILNSHCEWEKLSLQAATNKWLKNENKKKSVDN